jgi:multidrug efflux system outer membrane protein
MKRPLLGLALLLALTACKKGPDFEPPAPVAPADFRSEMPAGESVANTDWWDLYQDPVLRDLIARGLENNRSLREALARIAEARSGLTIARSDKLPKVNGIAMVQIQPASGTDSVSTFDNLRLIASAGYEIDLWGRVARSNEAALQSVLATEEAFRTVTITLVSEIARAYLMLRDIDARIEIAEDVAEANRASFDIMSSRAAGGLVPEVDLRRQEISLADSDAILAALRRGRAQTENALSLLVGELPAEIARGATLAEQRFPPVIPPGLPSELLQRRPDIQAAERALHAQTARIGVAEANRWPSLNLSAMFGGKISTAGQSRGSNIFFNMGANLVAPIFNRGALKAVSDAERARTEQLLNQYEQAVLNAFREVEDAMVSVETFQLEHAARVRQVEASRQALASVETLYEGGMVSYQEVIDLQRGVFGSELQASEALQLQHSAVVQLYKALGGGWTPPERWESIAPPEEEVAAEGSNEEPTPSERLPGDGERVPTGSER